MTLCSGIYRAHVAVCVLLAMIKIWWQMSPSDRAVIYILDVATPADARREIGRAAADEFRRGWIRGCMTAAAEVEKQ